MKETPHTALAAFILVVMRPYLRPRGNTWKRSSVIQRVAGQMSTDQQEATFSVNTEFVKESPTKPVDAWISRRLARSRDWLQPS